MAVTPRVSLVAWAERQGGFIFVAVPNERGRYLRTDRSVALVPCPMCNATEGEPCRGAKGSEDSYSATTHHVRRDRAIRLFGRGALAGDVLAWPGPAVPDEWMEAAS